MGKLHSIKSHLHYCYKTIYSYTTFSTTQKHFAAWHWNWSYNSYIIATKIVLDVFLPYYEKYISNTK